MDWYRGEEEEEEDRVKQVICVATARICVG